MQQSQHNTNDLSWIKEVNDPTQLAQVASQVFSQIQKLDSGARDQVYSQLRNDVQFTNAIENFSPQTA